MIPKDKDAKLIKIYFFICDKFEELQYYCEHFSNNKHPKFTDQEIMTIYLYVMYYQGMADVIKKRDKAANDLFSRAVSRIRQPIEAFFNWLIEKVDIQRARKVRSAKGLLIHVFGRIAAAFLSFKFNP